jgi:plastocyanin
MSKYIIGALVVVALVLTGFFLSQGDAEKEIESTAGEGVVSNVTSTGIEHAVVLSEEGYSPSEFTIGLGDTVVFSADPSYGRPFWPASNVHPTHSMYSAFDPLEPVEPTATWSFVFDQEGEWRFHDHLAPYHTGTIIVK